MAPLMSAERFLESISSFNEKVRRQGVFTLASSWGDIGASKQELLSAAQILDKKLKLAHPDKDKVEKAFGSLNQAMHLMLTDLNKANEQINHAQAVMGKPAINLKEIVEFNIIITNFEQLTRSLQHHGYSVENHSNNLALKKV